MPARTTIRRLFVFEKGAKTCAVTRIQMIPMEKISARVFHLEEMPCPGKAANKRTEPAPKKYRLRKGKMEPGTRYSAPTRSKVKIEKAFPVCSNKRERKFLRSFIKTTDVSKQN